jgi:enoyl-[acyl-carrier-protein] reductase (NADH)
VVPVRREAVDLAMPWAGLVVGVIAFGVAHQFGSDGTFAHCLSISPGPLLTVSALAIVATIAGAFASWTVFRNEAEAPARKVVAIISIGSAAFFVLAMILPIVAALVIPRCFQ